MTASTEHRLEGLEPDNLLAFLSLLGLLRALEAAGWRPRAYWEGLPLRPVLRLREAKTQEQVALTAAEGCTVLARNYQFAASGEFKLSIDQLKSHLEAAINCSPAEGRSADACLSAFVVEGSLAKDLKPGKHAFARSPLDCLGGGQSDLLSTLRDGLSLLGQSQSTANALAKALFAVWKREDDRKSLRWDQSDYRRHAYSAKAPTKDHARQEWGANLLAIFGSSLLLGCATAGGRSKLSFLVLGSRLVDGSGVEVSWPIWLHPASTSGIQALLAHPGMSEDQPNRDILAALSVSAVYRARKIWPNQYAVFTRAEVV